MMINEYKSKKEELTIAMKAELAPMWAEIVKVQAEESAKKAEAKKAARIAMLEEELAKLKVLVTTESTTG